MQRISLAVVGVGFDNKSGPSRRFEVAMCKPGEPVTLIPEPKNPADPRAIAVYSLRGIQLGYLKAERAAFIGAAIRRGIVNAIFQQAEEWGATIRAHLDGSEPTLPLVSEQSHGKSVIRNTEQDWWPDEEWPDD